MTTFHALDVIRHSMKIGVEVRRRERGAEQLTPIRIPANVRQTDLYLESPPASLPVLLSRRRGGSLAAALAEHPLARAWEKWRDGWKGAKTFWAFYGEVRHVDDVRAAAAEAAEMAACCLSKQQVWLVLVWRGPLRMSLLCQLLKCCNNFLQMMKITSSWQW